MKRIIERDKRTGKAIALYDSLENAEKGSGITKDTIVLELRGVKRLRKVTFEWEVTNAELREKLAEERNKKLNKG